MKKIIILLLFPILTYGQSAVLHFYYGSNEMMGGEMLLLIKSKESTYLGGGFSAALNKNKAAGAWRSGTIKESELPIQTSTTKEKWCSLYVTNSFGYLGKVLIVYQAGMAVYDEKANFKGQNPSTLETEFYNKNDKVLYQPMFGIGGMCQLTEDYGLQAGWGSFNGLTIGFNVLF
jgi:hypothetical protein